MQRRFEVSKACDAHYHSVERHKEREREICSSVYSREDDANQRSVVFIFTRHMEPEAKSLQRNTALLFRSERARAHTHTQQQGQKAEKMGAMPLSHAPPRCESTRTHIQQVKLFLSSQRDETHTHTHTHTPHQILQNAVAICW